MKPQNKHYPKEFRQTLYGIKVVGEKERLDSLRVLVEACLILHGDSATEENVKSFIVKMLDLRKNDKEILLRMLINNVIALLEQRRAKNGN